MQRYCEIWPHKRVDAAFKAPVESDLPVLLLSGEVDPVTPPANAEEVASHLSNSLQIVAPGQGHNVIIRGCIPRLFSDFIDTGSIQGIDTGCVNNLKPMPFSSVPRTQSVNRLPNRSQNTLQLCNSAPFSMIEATNLHKPLTKSSPWTMLLQRARWQRDRAFGSEWRGQDHDLAHPLRLAAPRSRHSLGRWSQHFERARRSAQANWRTFR